jgi:hypothetical protein
MIINNVDKYRVVEPLFEGIRVILSCLKESYSPEYIQGISGAAFRIGGICPCAPTCTYAMEPIELIKMLGYDAKYIAIDKNSLENQGESILKQIKEEIKKMRPVLVWHAFTNYEWDVVCGFDDSKKLLYGRGSYLGDGEYASSEETRFLNCDNCPGVIFIGQKVSLFDAKKAEEKALREAVQHAHSEKNKDKIGDSEWVFLEGLNAYQRWINDFKSPEKKRTQGDSYCYMVYRTTHRAAAGFLREIAPKYTKAEKHLYKAAENFYNEADTLNNAHELLWWDSPEGPDLERNKKISDILSTACNQYTQGIKEIEAALNYF